VKTLEWGPRSGKEYPAGIVLARDSYYAFRDDMSEYSETQMTALESWLLKNLNALNSSKRRRAKT
jgi:hypothetical protein